jgi:very-short-patch-repair endonuclease
MWACLRGRRMNKRKFRCQHPQEPYILDFYCADLKLAIELDGGQHNTAEGKRRDKAREAFLRSHGIETLRFTNDEMMRHTDSVMNVIWKRTAFTP